MTTYGNDKNIIVGAAALFVSPSGTAQPSLVALTPAFTAYQAAAGWRNVGFTDGGIAVSYEPTFGDVTVDQLLDSARVFKSGMKVTITTGFSEATLENLVVVWGQADSTLTPGGTDTADTSLTIEGGSLGEAPHERQLAFAGPGPRRGSSGQTTERLYTVGRAIQTQTSAHDLKRDAATTFPVSFRCLPGTTGSYGTVVDRAVTAN